MNLVDTVKDGFNYDVKGDPDLGLAFVSLKVALKAYFSTYETIKHQLHMFEEEGEHDQETIDSNHNSSYCEACAETIIHFQHFAQCLDKVLLHLLHQ